MIVGLHDVSDVESILEENLRTESPKNGGDGTEGQKLSHSLPEGNEKLSKLTSTPGRTLMTAPADKFRE